MGIYLQQNGARSLIGGGTKQLEKRVSAIEQGRASETAYGLVELCNSSTVTNSTGKALPASENNAGLPGTMANRIEKLNQYQYVSMMDHIVSDKIVQSLERLHDCYVQKTGNHADLKLAFRPDAKISGGELLFLVPEGFRPRRHVKLCAITESASFFPATVERDGRVYLDADATENRWVFIYASYIVA